MSPKLRGGFGCGNPLGFKMAAAWLRSHGRICWCRLRPPRFWIAVSARGMGTSKFPRSLEWKSTILRVACFKYLADFERFNSFPSRCSFKGKLCSIYCFCLLYSIDSCVSLYDENLDAYYRNCSTTFRAFTSGRRAQNASSQWNEPKANLFKCIIIKAPEAKLFTMKAL